MFAPILPRPIIPSCMIHSLTHVGLSARGESPAAFGQRCIPPPPQRGCRVGDPGVDCVAPRSNTPGILTRRALPGPDASSITGALGATPDFHHGLLTAADEIIDRVLAVV